MSQFRGLALTSSPNSVISVNPDIPEAKSLLNWFKMNGSGKDFTTVASRTQSSTSVMDTPFITLHQINSFQNMSNDKSEFMQVIAMCEFLKTDNLIYKVFGSFIGMSDPELS